MNDGTADDEVPDEAVMGIVAKCDLWEQEGRQSLTALPWKRGGCLGLLRPSGFYSVEPICRCKWWGDRISLCPK